MALKKITLNGTDYVRLDQFEEALSLIAGFSELYDSLGANPSEPSREEINAEVKLSNRWNKLLRK